jgi:hypothetical protein
MFGKNSNMIDRRDAAKNVSYSAVAYSDEAGLKLVSTALVIATPLAIVLALALAYFF